MEVRRRSRGRNTEKFYGTGRQEREKSEAGNDAKRDWTLTETGASGRWYKIAGFEKRGE